MAEISYCSNKPDLSVGYVYLWINLENGKRYIGSHGGNNVKYLASGVLIKRAFEKHGMDSFERSYLYVGPNYATVEQEILEAIDAMGSENYYNLTNMYQGVAKGYKQSEEHSLAISTSLTGYKHTEEHRRRNSVGHVGLLTGERNGMYGVKLTGESNGFYGKRHTAETRAKNRESHLGVPAWNKGIPMRPESRIKLSQAQKGKDINPANHNRWHRDRGIVNENCSRCKPTDQP